MLQLVSNTPLVALVTDISNVSIEFDNLSLGRMLWSEKEIKSIRSNSVLRPLATCGDHPYSLTLFERTLVTSCL